MSFFSKQLNRHRESSSSNIDVLYGDQVPFEDILDVLYPIFSQFYPAFELIRFVQKAKHVFCGYDRRRQIPVACGLLNKDRFKNGLYLTLFGVRKSAQGRGAGTALLKQIVRWAAQSGFDYVHLHVNVSNTPAIALYHKVGFQIVQKIPFYYKFSPKESPHGYRMVLSFV